MIKYTRKPSCNHKFIVSKANATNGGTLCYISLCRIYVPGAVERTGGICPFERKLRSCDCFAGDILAAGEAYIV